MSESIEAIIDRFYADIGRRIRDARVRTGATQAQLATQASMTRSSLANIEAGRQRIPVHVLVLVSEALNVAPTELFSPRLSIPRSPDLSEFLSDLDATTREFIKGAITQLGAQIGEEEK